MIWESKNEFSVISVVGALEFDLSVLSGVSDGGAVYNATMDSGELKGGVLFRLCLKAGM